MLDILSKSTQNEKGVENIRIYHSTMLYMYFFKIKILKFEKKEI